MRKKNYSLVWYVQKIIIFITITIYHWFQSNFHRLSTTLHNSILLTEAAKFSLLYIIYKHYVSFDKLTSVHEPQITFIHHSIITSLFPEKTKLLSFLSLRRLPSYCTPINFLSLVMKNVRFVTKKYISWFYNYSKRLQGCLLSATSECLS